MYLFYNLQKLSRCNFFLAYLLPRAWDPAPKVAQKPVEKRPKNSVNTPDVKPSISVETIDIELHFASINPEILKNSSLDFVPRYHTSRWTLETIGINSEILHKGDGKTEIRLGAISKKLSLLRMNIPSELSPRRAHPPDFYKPPSFFSSRTNTFIKSPALTLFARQRSSYKGNASEDSY